MEVTATTWVVAMLGLAMPFNQGSAWADPFLWVPLQIAGSIGLLLGERLDHRLVHTAGVRNRGGRVLRRSVVGVSP